MRRERLIAILGVVLLAAAAAGCLDFDEQVVYGEYDEQNDRVVLVIAYLGLYETEQEGLGAGRADQQLREALDGKTVALFGNWPFAFPVGTLRAELARPAEEAEDGIPPDLRPRLLELLERVRVLNGGFYTDAEGRACGAQVVLIERASDTIPRANALFNDALVRGLEAKRHRSPSEQLILAAAREGHTWMRLKGHSLIVACPLPEEELREGRGDFVSSLVEQAFTDDQVRLRGLRDMISSPFFVWHEDDMLTVKLGLERTPSFLVFKPRHGRYSPNLLDHIRDTCGFELDGLLARYLADPEAAAETEPEQAAQLIAPRLPKRELVRVLVRALRAEPTAALWTRLREMPVEEGMPKPGELTDQELLERWEAWLAAGQAAEVARENAPVG